MSPGAGLRERKKAQLRLHLATTALGLFLERGFDAVPVAEIAAAAGVSKMTVFNHFPAKEDLVLELAGNPLPDLAMAVRGRGPDERIVDALRGCVRDDFEARAAIGRDPGERDRLARFLQMVFRSPTLVDAFGRRWTVVQFRLAAALSEALGEPAPPDDIEGLFFRVMRGEQSPTEMSAWLLGMGEASLRPFFASGQIVGVLQQITMTNLVRHASGLSVDDALAAVLRDVEIAFDMLTHGLGDLD